MNGGSQVVGLWPNRTPDARTEDGTPDLAATDMEVGFDEAPLDEERSRDWPRTIAAAICAIAAVGWVVFLLATRVPVWLATPPTSDQIASAIAVGCAPLAVIGILYSLIMRGGRAETSRFGLVSAQMRIENERLSATLLRVSDELARQRVLLGETSEHLLSLGEDATHHVRALGQAMGGDVDMIVRHTQALKQSASTARAEVAVLLSDLPKALIETHEMVVALERAGLSAHEQVGQLDAQLSVLTVRGREADEVAGNAAQKLAAHLGRIEGVSATAGTRLNEAATTMTEAVDLALNHAARAGDAARQGMEAQGAAMMALVDQAQAALARTGADSAHAIAVRIDDAGERVEAMGALLAGQSEATALLMASLREGLDSLDGRFAALDERGTARSERLAATLSSLSDHAGTLTGALERGAGTADALIGRTEKLMTALDATTREIDEALPAAFDRLDKRALVSKDVVTRTSPEVEALERNAASALDRLMEAEALLAKQRVLLDDFAEHTDGRLAASGDTARALLSEIEKADGAARELANGASSQLVEALIRVRETAQAAADRARDAISRVIPESAEKLSEASRDALTKAISEQVEVHIAELGATAERALETAHKASDRLMRQMLTIADTSAAVETRIAEARAEVQDNDSDNFARRVALLIESLNSTAIDVTKILSNETTDAAWASYLRGDRGVFTRRAVRLLDSGEVREILRHYDGEAEFRDQVNRYIHDFEAMLRNVLATRDGSALGVTLLSSDMGKLYVALAQAIERLRA
ncbi:hypothetical protein D3Y57_06675 [Sphingomonas paeninsulae]|uniref:ATPase n=1 Tax=Sphingomonas paeninsulae TaxID=2319844 RepID=A0A494T9R4_SPHPE|nr:hypothetical protein D3Y57_06675 [Sphingomonas paeninsulae]